MNNENTGVPNHFIVLIPGYMGSKLKKRSSDEMIWLDLRKIFQDPSQIQNALDKFFCDLRYPNDDLEPIGIIDQLVFLPPLFKQEHYGRFFEALKKMGYEIGTKNTPSKGKPYIYTFPYDWRQDNQISARQLGIAIQNWKEKHNGAKVWIVAHSNGGIIARWYIEKEGGKAHVNRLFLLGSPWDGAPKAMQVLFDGPEVFLLRLFHQFNIDKLIHETLLSFPSFYQLLPFYTPFLRTLDDVPINPFEDHGWIKTENHFRLLENAKKFYEDLGTELSVETFCFFGIKKSTVTGGVVELDPNGQWEKINWEQLDAGDGTVPLYSAVHKQATEKLPYPVSHGDIYCSTPILNKLEWEFTGRFSDQLTIHSARFTQNLEIHFETDSDFYAPNDTIHLQLKIRQLDTNQPVRDAAITVRTEWAQEIPILSESPPSSLPFISFPLSNENEGIYHASIIAPSVPGYYRLVAMIETPDLENESIEEIVLIEPIDANWID